MISYFDTSAFVPLLIKETGSDLCRQLWNDADAVVTSRLLFVEAAAALAQGRRLGRLSESEHRVALAVHRRLWAGFDVVEADEAVVLRAAELADQLALRGYDAVHAASAEQIQDDDLVVASGDQKLLVACGELGMATADTAGAP